MNDNKITLRIEMPVDAVIDETITDALKAYGKEQAREIVKETMHSEIQRICESSIKELNSTWYEDTKLGKKINEIIANGVKDLTRSINLNKDSMLKELKSRVEEAECYTEEKINLALMKQVAAVAQNMGATKEFKQFMLDAVAREVQLTYPMQIAQLIDQNQQKELRNRIAELETIISRQEANRQADAKHIEELEECIKEYEDETGVPCECIQRHKHKEDTTTP